jgi:hypothetical protein
MHFKFFSDFYTEAENEAARKEHWDSAAQYAAYWNILCENPSLSAYFEGSVKYTNSMQLVELGLLRMAPGFSGFRESS